MSEILKRSKQLEQEIITNRRYIHKHAEIRNELENTCRFIKEKLVAMGLVPVDIGTCGLSVLIGKEEGRVILLRADMDALPLVEENDLEFKSVTPYSHMCGHDIHAAMLLGACKILKENEDKLEGQVKVLFQPDEEGGKGAMDMVENGILQNPRVDRAIALHVDAKSALGKVMYGRGCTFCSSDSFEIVIDGKSGHGARPHECVDVINVGSHINIALQTLLARECIPSETGILTICSFNSGDAFNIFPQRAILKGSLRTYNSEVREFLLKRLKEVCDLTAETFRAKAAVNIVSGTPPVYCDEQFTDEIMSFVKEILPSEMIDNNPVVKMGSEDFAHISEEVKSTFLFLGVGKDNQSGYENGQHSTKAIFNEDAFYIGSAVYAQSAIEWLRKGKY